MQLGLMWWVFLFLLFNIYVLVHIFVLIGLVSIIFSHAFPQTSLYSPDNDRPIIADNLDIVRREEYDPYGFNSILSRYYKRSRLYGIIRNEDDFSNELNFI